MVRTRKLGRQGLEVSLLGLGGMSMTGIYGPADHREAAATIRLALELGVNFLDTAELYGPYRNEELLGAILKTRRERPMVATKIGYRIVGGEIVGLDSRPSSIRIATEASLRRLQVECIDLLYQHRTDPAVPIEDVVGTMGDLVREGKARFVGLCKVDESTIRRAHATHPISVVQSEYSLWNRSIEDDVIPVLRELEIGLVPYSPLGRGFLTGKATVAEESHVSDYRRTDARFLQ